jgi:GNAT superfamily N-acetyltransferase
MTSEAGRAPAVRARYLVGISRYQDSDAADLRAFQERMFGEGARQLDPQRFAWLFERNPCRSPEGPGLWVCRRDGKIVGQQAEIAFELSVGGRARPAAWTIDLMVDPEWRIKGVGPGLVATQLASCELAIGFTHSEAAVKVYQRGGWAQVATVPVYLRPLDTGRALRHAPIPPRLRRLAEIAAPVVRGVDSLLAAGARAAGLRLVPVDRFDERVDDVWAAAAKDFPVLARRDAATTRWRLDDRPDADRLRRYYLQRRGRTLGYVAMRPTERAGDPAALVVDYLAPVRWVTPLLTSAAHAARADGATVLVCRTLCQRADRALRRAGFIRRGDDVEAPLRFFAHSAPDERDRSAIEDAANWLVTAADSDLELPGADATTSSEIPAVVTLSNN